MMSSSRYRICVHTRQRGGQVLGIAFVCRQEGGEGQVLGIEFVYRGGGDDKF